MLLNWKAGVVSPRDSPLLALRKVSLTRQVLPSIPARLYSGSLVSLETYSRRLASVMKPRIRRTYPASFSYG